MRKAHWLRLVYLPMADTNIFDCSLADLLCNEETTGLCFDDNDDVFDPFNDQKSHGITNGAKTETRRDSGALVYLPILSEECVSWMVESEREHLPRADYLTRLRTGDLDTDLRSRALHWMFKVHFIGDSWFFVLLSINNSLDLVFICDDDQLGVHQEMFVVVVVYRLASTAISESPVYALLRASLIDSCRYINCVNVHRKGYM